MPNFSRMKSKFLTMLMIAKSDNYIALASQNTDTENGFQSYIGNPNVLTNMLSSALDELDTQVGMQETVSEAWSILSEVQ